MNFQIIIIIILSLILIYNITLLYITFTYLFDGVDYSLCKNTIKYQIALLDDNLLNIDTGDILLFSTYSYVPLMRIFGHKAFSHMGMVLKLDNQYYSLELTNFDMVNDQICTNQIIVPLYDRINTYSGNVFISKIQNPLSSIQFRKLYNLIKKDNIFLKTTKLYLNMIHNIDFTNQFTCSTYIFYILQHLNIIDSKIKIKNINIHSFLIELCHNSNIYRYPVELLCNLSNVTKLHNKTIEYPNI